MKKIPWLVALVFFGVVAAIWWRLYVAKEQGSVVVYVSHDEVFSEPILKDFEKETGIRVRAVYDTEETKSTGAMNRLIAEKNNPQADVYWANEPIRAEILRQHHIATPYLSPNAEGIPATFRDPQGYWTGFAARARVLIVHEGENLKPTSVFSYSDPRWRNKIVIANPLFGTTTDQIAALFVLLGDERGQVFMQDLHENGVKLSPSNGDSADLVARGQFAFSLVDSDDVVNRINQHEPVTMVYPDQGPDEIGCFVVPNAAVLIAGSPHQESGKKLIDYLLSAETERKLAFSDAAQIPLHPNVATPPQLKPIESIKVMKVDYAAIAAKLQSIQSFLKSWAGL
ncbi:extracellular solute-binding protein [Beijerinckia indica]|uniref:Extracellular solute-binding protein family 1 n=1 Tax=Beijerinckia indica subsp. indica (strain ATCC 9039 / DSM 1715 / NCIMB 8712) TaxID=395963 RepID=B2IIH0_BEII9|nr:extracellular solute-binding protein [Beijerinckia indica]ACB96123.1 extracellular solute-binding protein family 1 [Beijerinckia indica subsp. indica ATCC 9039]